MRWVVTSKPSRNSIPFFAILRTHALMACFSTCRHSVYTPSRDEFKSQVLSSWDRDTNLTLFLKNLAFTFLVPGVVAVYVPVCAITHAPATTSPVAMLGGLALLIGALIYVWCVWDFATVGRGTPAPIDPPETLVVRGLYKHTRNPMYLGVLCVILGWTLLFRSQNLAIYAACVATCFHLTVLLYEEPHLRRVFGPSYEQYCSQVRRWVPITRSGQTD